MQHFENQGESSMADTELELLRRRKLAEMQKRVLAQKTKEEAEKEEAVDAKRVLDQIFTGRAWEVFNAARDQYPQVMERVEEALVRLVLEGRMREKISGEELFAFFRQLGLRVRLETHIRVMEHGKLKTLAEKMKER